MKVIIAMLCLVSSEFLTGKHEDMKEGLMS
jgi:hypothetical protein